MRLKRIRDHAIARLVARGVSKYNGVSISSARVLHRPHYVITSRGRTAGWVGIEQRGHGTFEVCHLSVLPSFRRRGLAQSAVAQALSNIRMRGGRYAYARIFCRNYPSIQLMRKLAFRKTKGGRVCLFGRVV